MEAKLVSVGNSRGMRLPKSLIIKYKLDSGVVIEEREDGLMIKPKGGLQKLSWEETYKQMAKEKEDWSDWDALSGEEIE